MRALARAAECAVAHPGVLSACAEALCSAVSSTAAANAWAWTATRNRCRTRETDSRGEGHDSRSER
jgi:hypothetical protein